MVEMLLRQRYSASDPVAASGAFRAVFGDGEVTADAGAFSFEQLSLVDDGVSVTRIAGSGTNVRLTTGSAPELVPFVVREGSVELRRGVDVLRVAHGEIGLLPIGQSAELRWTNVRLDLFSLPTTSVSRLLGTNGEALRVHAPRLTSRSAAIAAFWNNVARVLSAQVLDAPELYERDLIRGQIVDALTAATIEAFDLSNWADDDVDRDAAIVRRALASMQARLADPVSMPEIAAQVGVSIRGLQMVFNRQLGSTPLAQLRLLRLTEARNELLHAPTGSSSVTSVARRFGYSNVGRFISHYRSEFGEAPSVTLQAAVPGRT